MITNCSWIYCVPIFMYFEYNPAREDAKFSLIQIVCVHT